MSVEVPDNRVRDGGNKIVKLARALVVITQTFAGILIQKYGEDSAIGLLVKAILNLSLLLPSADAEVVEYGGQNEPVVIDPSSIPGINAGAPLPPELP